MRRLIDFYRLQIEVMRTWRPSSGSRVRRLLVTLIVSAGSFLGAVALTPGVEIRPGAGFVATAVVAALALGVMNVLVRPIFLGAFAGISVIAVAIATLVFQVVSFLVLPVFVGGLVVQGILAALVASLMYAFVNTVLTAVFSISQDDAYFAVLM
ncbi:MAG TPA: phage holin family protein, partial [Candidatus Nanopelagicales bacterium]|nr:phage holin family protein [Candidatus Nanopelagicales bacterium]